MTDQEQETSSSLVGHLDRTQSAPQRGVSPAASHRSTVSLRVRSLLEMTDFGSGGGGGGRGATFSSDDGSYSSTSSTSTRSSRSDGTHSRDEDSEDSLSTMDNASSCLSASLATLSFRQDLDDEERTSPAYAVPSTNVELCVQRSDHSTDTLDNMVLEIKETLAPTETDDSLDIQHGGPSHVDDYDDMKLIPNAASRAKCCVIASATTLVVLAGSAAVYFFVLQDDAWDF